MLNPHVVNAFLGATCLLAAACSAGREPIYLAPQLKDARITTLAVAPILDARRDVFHDVEVVGHVRRTVDAALSEKGYAVVSAELGRAGERYTAGDIAKMSQAELAAAAPKDVRYLMVVSLDGVERDVGELGKTIRVKVSGRLIDADEQREVWRDLAEGDADLSGLLTVLTGPAPDYEAAYDATRTLFSTLPDGHFRGSAATRDESAPPRAPTEGMHPTKER